MIEAVSQVSWLSAGFRGGAETATPLPRPSLAVAIDAANPALSRVVRTLLVGDEPRDIVFAGAAGDRAFITTARRGQNLPASVPANLTTPGTPRALVWAFDANNLGAALGGTPLSVIALFSDTPRALAVSNDRATVYAAAFHSGNRTTALLERVVTPGGGVPPFPPGATPGAPNTGLIVRFNGSQWVDEINRRLVVVGDLRPARTRTSS